MADPRDQLTGLWQGECNLCGDEGERWELINPDGIKTYVVVCNRHAIDLHHLVKHGTPARRGPVGIHATPIKIPDKKPRKR